MREFRPYKTGGPDELIPKMLQSGVNTLFPYMGNVLRASATLGCVSRAANMVFSNCSKERLQLNYFGSIILNVFLMKKLVKRYLTHEISFHSTHIRKLFLRNGTAFRCAES